MRSEYGNLRRRTRDAGWQWMFIGMGLGMSFALVLCVGGYALGAITFPALEEDTATPRVQVEPNETEVALQLEAQTAQQTLDAITAQQTLSAQAAPTENTPADAAPTSIEVTEPAQTPAEETVAQPRPTPSLLPGNGEEVPRAARPSRTQAEGTSGEGDQAAPQTTPSAEALPQETPVVGTPPIDQSPAELGLPQGPAIPAELDAIKTELATVTGGTFMMGTTLEEATQAVDECALYDRQCDIAWAQDSTPAHQVTVDTFAMEIYEVSVSQYVAFLNWKGPNSHKTGCQGQPCALTTQEEQTSYIDFDGTTYAVRNAQFYSEHPVMLVTWWGAVEYCDALNRRLPTEAEWERAARGAQNNYYPWGFEFNAAYASTSISEPQGTVPVSSFPEGASPYGILNMAGNAEEWVFDWYQENYYGQVANNPVANPQGPPTGTEKVVRGGSWDTIPFFVRSMHRRSEPPGQPLTSTGFRCATDTTTAPPPVTAPTADMNTDTSDTSADTAPTMAPPPTTAPAESTGPTATLDPGG